MSTKAHKVKGKGEKIADIVRVSGEIELLPEQYHYCCSCCCFCWDRKSHKVSCKLLLLASPPQYHIKSYFFLLNSFENFVQDKGKARQGSGNADMTNLSFYFHKIINNFPLICR